MEIDEARITFTGFRPIFFEHMVVIWKNYQKEVWYELDRR